MIHRKDLGSIGEITAAKVALEYGCKVFFSFGDNSKTDFIIEDQDKGLHRIQVKCLNRSTSDKNVTQLSFTKSAKGYSFEYSSDDCDYFAVVDAETLQVAWVNSKIISDGRKSISLRHNCDFHPNGKIVSLFLDFMVFPFGKKQDLRTSIRQFDKPKQKFDRAANQQPLIDLVLNSTIDFEKYGWVGQASKLLDKHPQKINQWMKKYMPDFYNDRCFKKKLNGIQALR